MTMSAVDMHVPFHSPIPGTGPEPEKVNFTGYGDHVDSPLQLNGNANHVDPQRGSEVMSDIREEPNDEERSLAAQLSHLASQHHSSEYNIVKFGPRGSPLTYVPMSVHLPSHVRDLRKRQWGIISADGDPWWLARPSEPDQSSHIHPPPARRVKSQQPTPSYVHPHQNGIKDEAAQEVMIEEKVTSTSLTLPHAQNGDLQLQRDLDMAMSSPLSLAIPIIPSQMQVPMTTPALKTSKTHPINISPLIPTELLPIMSAHLQPSDIDTATVFELPESMRLERLTLPPGRSLRDAALAPPTRTSWMCEGDATPPILWNPNGALSPLQAIESPLAPPPLPPVPPLPNSMAMDVDGAPPVNSDPLPPYLTPLPVPLLPISTAHPRQHSQPPSIPASPRLNPVPPPTPDRRPSSPILHRDLAKFPFPPPVLGNLLLSSCPGKKVRLTGPVKGRGSICRDLGVDLGRMASMGVGCVICCLDDDELEFLGATWGDYARLAKSMGIDILRIPMPEGLTPHPSTIASFNCHLDTLIQRYTLRGIPVLVHCRGGVGRAGLVACCWMIKVGLCGWLPPSTRPSSPVPVPVTNGHVTTNGISNIPVAPVRIEPAVLELVEKAIVVVRRRRSVKAIETYEQVRFLIEFVNLLQGMRTAGGEGR